MQQEILDTEVWAGVQRLLTDYAELEDGDDVVIAYTPDSRESAALVGVACEQRGVSVSFIPMRPLSDRGFPERLAARVPHVRTRSGKCLFLTFEKDTMSHHGEIRAFFSSYDPTKYRVIRAINAGRDLFATGLASSPRELSALNTSLIERLMRAEHLSIETDQGTKLVVQLDNQKFRFVSNRGLAQPRQFVIIPAGEVATFPAHISGKFIADFALNVNMLYDGDARLHKHPVTAWVDDGRLQDFECDDDDVRRFLDECFGRKNARFVGELGFGTNRAVKTAVYENSHLNERVPGVHLGFGQHNQTNETAGYACDVHVDLCAKGGKIWLDGENEPIDLEALTPSFNPHPDMVRDEDVFSEEIQVSDCCGLLTQSPGRLR